MIKPSSYVPFALLPAVLFLLFLSCKKEALPVPEPTKRTAEQLVKDSVYYYFNKYSLWSDAATVDQSAVAAFTDKYDSPLGVLNALKSMTPTHAAYNGAIDRFSYLEQDGHDGLQATGDTQVGAGFGLYLSIGAVSETMAYPVVYFVEGGSAAERAGIRRSDVILGIDEQQDLGMPINCGANGCSIVNEQQQQHVVNRLLSAMEQRSMRIKVRHADNSEIVLSLTSTPYDINPIVKKAVFNYPAKRIGYLALSSFEELAEGQLNRYRLDQVFQEFESSQINDLILDLRYNTGGYISAAEYVANRVIGPQADNTLMYKYQLNAWLSQRSNWKGQSFDDVYFRRRGNLDLNTVYFLVTDITASASELLINVLRPYMKVVIIAENDATYGKPVGFFKQEIMGETALWAASFKLINSRGESDYWDGINADQRNVTDYIFADFGDPEESMLSAALTQSLGGQKPSATMSTFKKTVKTRKTRIALVNAIPQTNMFR